MKRPAGTRGRASHRERPTEPGTPPDPGTPRDPHGKTVLLLSMQLAWKPDVPEEKRAGLEKQIHESIVRAFSTPDAEIMLKQICAVSRRWQVLVSDDENQPEPAQPDVERERLKFL